MNRIRLLPDHVANQIAAGEVVERPASVVKELVENALDADAHRVTVEIGAGGRSLIRVTDDGYGMSRDDALLCLERHATSKIRKAEDLSAITTMGFRGEALPSIASISRFTLTSRERDETTGEGTSVIVQGGRIAEVRAAANPHGTSIEARSLFFNLPARRKFLRSEETERSHIQHYLVLAALGPRPCFRKTSRAASLIRCSVWVICGGDCFFILHRSYVIASTQQAIYISPMNWLFAKVYCQLRRPQLPEDFEERACFHHTFFLLRC